MREIFGNLWEAECDLRVITTNPMINAKGQAVMGRGCALEAKKRIPGIEYRFAGLLGEHGNRVMRLERHGGADAGADLASFPVKHHWREKADPDLIRRSALQLVALADKFGYETVLLPRPGCGNGNLSFSDVRPLLADVLDERFSVITFPVATSPRNGGSHRLVRESRTAFVTGRVTREVLEEGLSSERAEVLAAEANDPALATGALTHHVVEPAGDVS